MYYRCINTYTCGFPYQYTRVANCPQCGKEGQESLNNPEKPTAGQPNLDYDFRDADAMAEEDGDVMPTISRLETTGRNLVKDITRVAKKEGK